MTLNARIALEVVLAQICSDAGKGVEEVTITNERWLQGARWQGYRAKTAHILRAVTLINSAPLGAWRYYIVKQADQNGYQSVLVYFEHHSKECGRLQISFHTPFDGAPRALRALVGRGRKTRWDKNFGGSREACKSLVSTLKL